MCNLKSRLPFERKARQKYLKVVNKVQYFKVFREESYINLLNISQKSKLYKTFVKVDCNFFVRQSQLFVFHSCGVKHTLGGKVAARSVILVGKVENLFDSALDYCLGTLVAGEKSNVNAASVQRCTGVLSIALSSAWQTYGYFVS